MNFFGIVSEKTFAIQPIPGNLIARISGNIHERKISQIITVYLNILLPVFTIRILVRGIRCYSSDLPQGGIEILCKLIFKRAL